MNEKADTLLTVHPTHKRSQLGLVDLARKVVWWQH
jgi:hypothetical protein